jgi:colanic acid biosynthesis glycosyl transferase WcaI
LNHSTFSLTAFLGGLAAGKPDVLLSFSPPLPLGISAWLLSRFWRVPWILNVQDIYPEIAIASGLLRNRLAIAFFLALERFLYQKADHIEVISDGFRTNLQHKRVPAEKITVIPVWADPEAVRPGPKENSFRQQHGLSGKFVVMHAGNFGLNNSLEDIIQAAEILKDEEHIRFVMVGEGEKKADLCEQARRKGLENVLFLPYQPRESYESMLAAADLGLVSLSAGAHAASFPSKTLNILASGRPILAITPPDSEITHLVCGFDCGVAISPGNPADLAQTILELRSNGEVLFSLGNNGRKLLEEKYSRQQCVGQFAKVFQQIGKH